MTRELLQQAHDALMCCSPDNAVGFIIKRDAIAALRSALVAPQPEPVRILRAEMNIDMGLTAYLLTDFTVKTMSPTQADKMGWWKHGEHAAPGAAPPAAPAPAVPPVTNDVLDALELADRLCKEALPKFNWGASALNANAIDLLNRAPIAISKALAAPAVREPQEHIGWCRYVTAHEKATRLVLCDSDAPGAFRVYRGITAPGSGNG